MIRLYQTSALNSDELIELDKNPSHHLIRVLRAKPGSEVTLFNGDGYDYIAELVDDNPKNCHLKIKQQIKVENESSLRITLLQGISRGDRMDTTIQKSIELGVHAVTPVFCQRSGHSVKGERADKKQHHWQQIVISACEQSGRSYIPAVSPVTSFADALQLVNSTSKFILDPQAHLSFNQLQKPGRDICLLIGPEGGFSDDEIRQASASGFTAVSLGPRILRTETAGPTSIAIAQTLWGDLG